ncbi:MAG: hypothetical protein AAF393_10040 [Pseudomonadota bacterium]
MLRFALAIGLFLAAPAHSAEMKFMTGQIDFNKFIADKPWRGQNGDKGVFRKNGTWTATINGKRGKGTWVWVDQLWCRQGTLGGKPLKTDCQMLHADKTHFSITRDRGRGKTTLYKFSKSGYRTRHRAFHCINISSECREERSPVTGPQRRLVKR